MRLCISGSLPAFICRINACPRRACTRFTISWQVSLSFWMLCCKGYSSFEALSVSGDRQMSLTGKSGGRLKSLANILAIKAKPPLPTKFSITP